MTSRTINRAIKHTGLIINKGSGYQYFTDAVTNEQVGESVYVCYLNQYTIEQWIEEAEYARQNDHGCPRLSSML
jgi:hypothetical protein